MDTPTVTIFVQALSLFTVAATAWLHNAITKNKSETEAKIVKTEASVAKTVEAAVTKSDTDTVMLTSQIDTLIARDKAKDEAFTLLSKEKDATLERLLARVETLESEKNRIYETSVVEKDHFGRQIVAMQDKITALEAKIESLRTESSTEIAALKAENQALREELKAAQATIAKLTDAIFKTPPPT